MKRTQRQHNSLPLCCHHATSPTWLYTHTRVRNQRGEGWALPGKQGTLLEMLVKRVGGRVLTAMEPVCALYCCFQRVGVTSQGG